MPLNFSNKAKAPPSMFHKPDACAEKLYEGQNDAQQQTRIPHILPFILLISFLVLFLSISLLFEAITKIWLLPAFLLSILCMLLLIRMNSKLTRSLSIQSKNYEELRQELNRKNQDFSILSDISQMLNSTIDRHELLDRIVDTAIDSMEGKSGCIILFGKNESQPDILKFLGQEKDTLQKFQAEITAELAGGIEYDTPMKLTNREGTLQFQHGDAEQYQIASMISAPLKLSGKNRGVLAVFNKIGIPTFTDDDDNLMIAFANHAGIAIQRLTELDTLYNIISEVPMASSIGEAMNILLRNARYLVNVLDAGFFQWNNTKREWAGVSFDENREAAILPNTLQIELEPISPMFPEAQEQVREIALKIEDEIKMGMPDFSYLVSPVINSDEMVGVVLLCRDKEQPFSESDRKLLSLMTSQTLVLYERSASIINAAQLASLGEIATTLVHEVRNALNPIRSLTQTLEEQYGDADFRKYFIKVVITEVDRINQSMSGIRALSRYQLSEYKPVEVNLIFDDVLKMVSREIVKRRIELQKKYGTNLPQIYADENGLKQCFLNIILNALQAMPEGGTLCIEANLEQPSQTGDRTGCLSISISDTGPGIKESDREKVFYPFYTTKKDGTGLGLPASRRIIEKHGGKIFVAPEVSEGTTMVVELPLEQKAISNLKGDFNEESINC
jgi:signal transduction histidine kinase